MDKYVSTSLLSLAKSLGDVGGRDTRGHGRVSASCGTAALRHAGGADFAIAWAWVTQSP